MKIGILGTGMVGQALAGGLLALGHDVVIGTRDPQKTLANTKNDAMGNPPFRVWHERHPKARLATLAEAASHGEIVLNATNGAASLDALNAAGAAALAGKPLVDVSNPLDFSKGFPPTMFVVDTDSLGERIQRAFPDAKVVKTLNTVNASVMVDPGSVAGGEHTLFLCGNDAGAKAKVQDLLASFGWRDVIDLGDITGARGMEMILPLWLRLFGTLKTPMLNFKIAR